MKRKMELHQIISGIFEGYFVNDFTSQDYWSFEFIILVNKSDDILDNDIKLINSLDGLRKDINIYISKYCPFYYYTVQDTFYMKNQWSFEKSDINETEKSMMEILDSKLKQLGYWKLSDSKVHEIIPEIDTECKDFGEVTVFNAIFTDLYSFY